MNSIEDLRHASVALLVHRSEARVRTLATDLIADYRALDADQRLAFFAFLRDEMSVDHDTLASASDAHRADPTHETAADVHAASEAVRRDLFRLLNTAPGGTRAIVEMRADLLASIDAHPDLAAVDNDLFQLLRSWFNSGFLKLVQLDWSTPAFVLEKLIEYEAVHAIRSWADLHRRLESDRRLYAYMHPALPDEPLIFVEVALLDHIASSIDSVLRQPAQPGAPEPNAAIFYSITTTQAGLRGISFGSLLIKHVMQELQATVPSLNTFATLSPIPGFMRWLRKQRAAGDLDWMPAESLARMAAVDDTAWIDFPQTREALRPGLVQAAARYLSRERRPDRTPPQPHDPVARFHIRNGASLHRINWMGDPSPKGLGESAGMLVNYLYDPDAITTNLDAYAADGTIATSEEVAWAAIGELE